MQKTEFQALVQRYYQGWAVPDREQVRDCLADEGFTFRAPETAFYSADEFLDACWEYAAPGEVSFMKELYDGDEAFVVLEWQSDDENFHSAEYLRVSGDKIIKVITINSDPDFWNALHVS